MIAPGIEVLPPWAFQRGLPRGVRNTWRHGGWTGRFLTLFPFAAGVAGLAFALFAFFGDVPIEAVYPVLLTALQGMICFIGWTGPAAFSVSVLSAAQSLPGFET